jgi:hypothetical protein
MRDKHNMSETCRNQENLNQNINLKVHFVGCHYSLTHSLTSHNTVLLEKLTGLQLVKKFPTFYGTLRFITALTSARHVSLSWASPVQSITPHPTSWISIIILSSHLRLGLPIFLFPLRFPHQNPVHASPLPHPSYMPRPSHSSRPLRNKHCSLNVINIEIEKVAHWVLRVNKSELGSCRAQKFGLGRVATMIITGSSGWRAWRKLTAEET